MIKAKLKLAIVLGLTGATFVTDTKAQEVIESPLDTLARSVRNISDEITKMNRLNITGYIQPQWQMIDSAGAPSFAGGDFVNGKNKYSNRFTIRRGRFKFTYEKGNAIYSINTDITEKGVAIRESFVKLTDPWLHTFSITAGLLQDQFGFEVTQSSSVRETPERARYNQILFPTERDLGVFGRMQLPKTSKLFGLILDVAVMNGSAGVAPEFDSYKDFTGRVTYGKTTTNEKVAYSIGASYYNGGYRIGNVKDYNLRAIGNDLGFIFATDTANYERKAKREYLGVDVQLTIDSRIGITTLRAEYIQGEQPGTDVSDKSLGAPPTVAIYHRQFNGAYFYFIQNIGQSKFQVVAKYDWFDPNVRVAGKEIGKTGTNTKTGDIRFDTYGFGINYRLHSNTKLMIYYDLVKNEETLITGYKNDIKDNVLTIRTQYRF